MRRKKERSKQGVHVYTLNSPHIDMRIHSVDTCLYVNYSGAYKGVYEELVVTCLSLCRFISSTGFDYKIVLPILASNSFTCVPVEYLLCSISGSDHISSLQYSSCALEISPKERQQILFMKFSEIQTLE